MSKSFIFEHVEVIKVQDGDTITVKIDLGFRIYHDIIIRFDGFDAPETTKRGGASDAQVQRGKYVRDWLREYLIGKTITVETTKWEGDKEKYGRYLGKIYIEGNCLNDIMGWMGLSKTQEEIDELKKN